MSEIASASINTLPSAVRQAGFESPSDEAITISVSQLQDLIKEAVEQAIEPLQDRIEALDATVANQGEEIAALRSTVASLEKDRDHLSENLFIQLKLINDLREQTNKKAPGKTELSRAEKIERYLAGRPDHKATFETLKGVLQINNVLLNQTIKILMDDSPGRYGVTKAPGDKRKRTLVMLPR